MAIKALTIDLYGTLVKSSDDLMRDICQRINASSRVYESTAANVGKSWLNISVKCSEICYADKFIDEKRLDKVILNKLLDDYQSRLDADSLQKEIYDAYIRPVAFDDSALFLNRLPLPCYVLCNGDKENIISAMDYAGLKTDGIFCSEDARAYKPNHRIYEYAADALKLHPSQILHIGDSMNHDIIPAKKYGIKTALINRYGRNVPADLNCDLICSSLAQLRAIITG